ncbi:MAG: sigma-70 family RNA polymerase sigma factor [Pirellulales bacterium]|nr:sigma-70 family RNA polymerase sigma factor [Pirellulales bacterium]
MIKTTTRNKTTDSTARVYSQWTDEELLVHYRQTEERGAFEELVHRYERELYSYLRRYLGDEGMAEDAFQATFLQVHLKSDHFEPDRKFRPWLYTIATHQAIDAQRRTRRHKLVSLDRRGTSDNEQSAGALADLLQSREDGPQDELEANERGRWVRKTVESLPEQLRSAVNLIYYQGLKYREAADILNVPVGTVKSRLHTAVMKLNEAWNRANLSGAE